MLLPAYDINGRLYYPQYEEAPSSRSIANLPDRARRATTRTKSPCIEDTFYTYALRKQEEALMGVKPRRPSLKVTSKVVPPATAPIPKWTGKSDGEKRRKSGGGGVERSCGRDIVGHGPKPKESALSQCHDSSETLVSIVEAPCMTPPPSLDPATASDYSAFTDIVTPDSAHGYDSRPPSIVPSSFKTAKQFFSSPNTSTASLLSQTAPSPKKKFTRSALFPPVGEEEYPARGCCPNLHVLLMSRDPRPAASRSTQGSKSRSNKVRNARISFPAVSPPLEVVDEDDPITKEIHSALESVISVELRKDSSSMALVPRIPIDPSLHASYERPTRFTSYLSYTSTTAFKTFSGQSPIDFARECDCCMASCSSVKMSLVDEWIEAPHSIRRLRPPARRRADGSTLRKWCLEWQMVVHGKVDCVRNRRESKEPVTRERDSRKQGKERWGCGCVDHGFD